MSPIRVAVLDPHELSLVGLSRMLGDHPGRCRVVPLRPGGEPADVVLFGLDEARDQPHDRELHGLLRTTSSPVLATCWTPDSDAARSALDCGADAVVSKQLAGAELLAQVERVAARRALQRVLPDDASCFPEVARLGLSRRELEIVQLIASGLSNQDIADRLYLSINSVKTYVRTAYRKIGVERRPQAVLWAERQGLSSVDLGEGRDRRDQAG